MSWRPKNWDNPYREDYHYSDRQIAWCQHRVFEAGADAMLYAILGALLDRKIKFKRSRGVVELIVEEENEMPKTA